MKLLLMEKSQIAAYLDQHEKIDAAIKAKAAIDYDSKPESKSYEIRNGEALIAVSGSLQRTPDFFSFIFGSSTYDEIAQMTLDAQNDPDVEKIAYIINSPGGEVDGVDSLGQLIKAVEKPTVSYVDNMATSAAYWIASQTDKIVATSPTAEFGSIGVIVAGIDTTGVWENMGAKRILIASTDAPEKKLSYQLDTKEGEESMIKRLDALHTVFAERVADGRNTTADEVNENFGRGGVVSAEEALTKGMIDNIVGAISLKVDQENDIVSRETNERKANVDKEQIKKENPEIIGQIEKAAFDAGKDAGVVAERKRVEDLNAWRGKSEACDAIVDEAIKSGAEYSEVMSKIHASLPRGSETEEEPPAVNDTRETKIDDEEENKLTDDKMTKIGKEIAQGIGGTNG